MITVEGREAIRKAYYLEHKSIRQIAREQHHSRRTIRKALKDIQPQPYQRARPKPAPVFGSFQGRVDTLLAENETLPRKQRYTAHKIYEALVAEGYQGSDSRVRRYITQWKKEHQTPDFFLPLEYEPGQEAQCDWGEAIAIIGGVRQTVQVFVMRLCFLSFLGSPTASGNECTWKSKQLQQKQDNKHFPRTTCASLYSDHCLCCPAFPITPPSSLTSNSVVLISSQCSDTLHRLLRTNRSIAASVWFALESISFAH